MVKLTKEQAELAARLCKLALVEQIAKPPYKRDPEFKTVSFSAIEALIDVLGAAAAD